MALDQNAPVQGFAIRPLDAAGLLLAAAASGAILVNALMLQHGRPDDLQQSSSETSDSTPSGMSQPAGAAVAADPLVKEVQAELARRGVYDGTADGVLGPNTQSAIRGFEVGAGMKATGQASPKLLAMLRQTGAGAATPAPGPVDEVLQVQRALERLNMGPIKADGLFGEGTRAAIRRFETKRGLTPRGEITPALKKELFAAARTAG